MRITRSIPSETISRLARLFFHIFSYAKNIEHVFFNFLLQKSVRIVRSIEFFIFLSNFGREFRFIVNFGEVTEKLQKSREVTVEISINEYSWAESWNTKIHTDLRCSRFRNETLT